MMNSAQQSLRPISRSLFSALRTRAPTLRCPTQQVHRLTTAQSNRLRHASLPSLREQLDLRDGSLLPCALPYHLPSPHKNATATATTATKTRGTALARDLIVLEYFSSDRVFPSYTTGWLLDTPSKQPILVTCCHTLQETLSSTPSDTESGIRLYRHHSNQEIGYVSEVLTAWSTSDLLFLSPTFHLDQGPAEDDGPQPLTANPYPPAVGDALSFFQSAEQKTINTTVCLYTNPGGREVSPGSYAHLHAMDVAHLPSEGSSGGPLVDERGRVCGVMRGRTFAYGQRRPYGFATPAERIWEVFKLF